MHEIILFFQNNWGAFLVKVWEHLYISLIAGILGVIVAVPLGIALTRLKRGAGFIMGILSVIQTFPSFAILAFFIPLLGVGKVPAIVALFFYSLLPILRNTYTGVQGVDRNLLEAGKGMGMTVMERVWHVELPLAIPVIMAGIRLSIVYLIGWATLAAFIGAGGLGDYIFNGLDTYQPHLILIGAVPVTILALLVDLLLGRIEVGVTPKAIREINEA